ncbi:MAG: thioredoxin family protein [Planctomycetia bacterium]|nr:thioredoxin family protein [Planctomycetia bacterium]
MVNWKARFADGLSYADFLERHGTPEHRRRWSDLHAAVRLSEPQRELLGRFTRAMPVACLAGAWCGDCVYQCPILDHFQAASPLVQVRFFDRDANPDLARELAMCGGSRVPVVVFLSEDFEEVARYGDRTLARYRQMMAQMFGPSCTTGLVLPSGEDLAAVVQDWLDEFERVQWLLRISPRLRKVHGD